MDEYHTLQLSVRSHTLILKSVAKVYIVAETSTYIHLASTHTLSNGISSDVLFISHFQIRRKASLCMKRCICHRWCITKKRSPATIDTYIARITWYMQRNYLADILKEKAQVEEYHLLWSLFDCSFHVSSYATCAHAECGALTGRVTKIKNRRGDGAHHREERHFLMNGRPSLPPCPPFANVTLCKAICSEWQRSRQSYRPQHRLQILFIICCHKPEQGRQEWQVGVQQKKRERTKRHDMSHFKTTWALNFFSFFIFEDTCQLWLC